MSERELPEFDPAKDLWCPKCGRARSFVKAPWAKAGEVIVYCSACLDPIRFPHLRFAPESPPRTRVTLDIGRFDMISVAPLSWTMPVLLTPIGSDGGIAAEDVE